MFQGKDATKDNDNVSVEVYCDGRNHLKKGHEDSYDAYMFKILLRKDVKEIWTSP